MATASLLEASQSSFIKALGDIATGTFTCGGVVCQYSTVVVNYLNKSGTWNKVEFRGVEGPDLQQMLESSAVASFGRGKETVIDKSYRDAYVLDPEKFVTSFQLTDTGILGEVRRLLVPDAFDVRAELYKLNIYAAPSGGFKAHLDTPRGGNMFGTLVVCLPTKFTGGALITRHMGQKVIYDWSDNRYVQWAVFFSDVEHEILPVTEGHRVSLTYNLYHSDQLNPMSAVDVITSPFHNNLKAALAHPDFLPDGGVLGFACQHKYVLDDFETPKSLSSLLKGSDRTVLVAAKALGLKLDVTPIIVDARCQVVPLTQLHVREKFGFSTVVDPQDSEDYVKSLQNTDHITWCQKFQPENKQPALAVLAFGNQPYMDKYYQDALYY